LDAATFRIYVMAVAAATISGPADPAGSFETTGDGGDRLTSEDRGFESAIQRETTDRASVVATTILSSLCEQSASLWHSNPPLIV